MRKNKLYRYLGRNGILDTKVLLDGIDHIDIVILYADEGKILTNGEKYQYSVTVEAADAHQWREVADNTNK